MSIPEFFIKRPVFATILNCLLIVVGVLSYQHLTVREYPEVSIPTVSITIQYPNASAELVESDLTTTLEEELAGIPKLDRLFSVSKEGSSTITLVFKPGTKVVDAQAAIRDRLSQAQDKLPKDIKTPIIEPDASQTFPFLFIALTGDRYSTGELTHYATLYLKNTLKSLSGVAGVKVWGQPYAMLIKLDPVQLFAHELSVEDILKALKAHDASLPSGKYRAAIPMTLNLRPSNPEEFENIVLKQSEETVIFLKDIADVELSEDKETRVRLNGKPGVMMGVMKSSEGNPLEISKEIHEMLPSIQKQLPKGMHVEIVRDEADFIRKSLSNIKQSLVEAAVLVFLIIFLFLRNIRSTIIPLVAIPVSLISTLFIIYICGFSINTITLLALVLSIGIVVDDAIVVLENIHRYIERGMHPFQAACQGSRELGFAVVAMSLTLASVYMPVAFVQGMVGQVFIEFALTLAGAVILSGVVALTLSPMMCSRWLKAHQKDYFPRIEQVMKNIEKKYMQLLSITLETPKLAFISMAIMLLASGTLFWRMPQEITPKEDRGFVAVMVEGIPGETTDEVDAQSAQVEMAINDVPENLGTLIFIGEWGCQVILPLKDFDKRKRSSFTIIEAIREDLKTIPSLTAWPWTMATGLPGLENQGRNSMNLEVAIQTLSTYEELYEDLEQITAAFEEDKQFESVEHGLHLNAPGFQVKVDLPKAALLGIDPKAVARSLATLFNEDTTATFKKDGITYNVHIKSAIPIQYVDEIYLPNKQGKLVSLGSFVKLIPKAQPEELYHLGQKRTGVLVVSLKKNQTYQEAMKYIEEKLPKFLGDQSNFVYTGMALELKKSSTTLFQLFFFALIFIYAIMAIQFESFTDPLIIMLTVPLACAGALLALKISGQSLNIFTQIGLITLVGLITKHGILVVDFTNRLLAEGQSLFEAVKQAATVRLRPILMTTLATVCGHAPLIFATGAGGPARKAIGITLVCGLFFGTVLTLIVIPTVYLYTKQWLMRRKQIFREGHSTPLA